MSRLLVTLLAMMSACCWAESVAAIGVPCSDKATAVGDVVQHVVSSLQGQAHQPYAKVELEAIGPVPLVSRPTVTLKGAWPRSRVAVQLNWTECESGASRQVVVWFKVRVFQAGWRYGRDAKAEQPLATAEPEPTLVDIAALQLRADELAVAPDTEWLARSVRAGEPILQRDLTLAPMVKRNERVTVIVKGNGLVIRTQGTALRNGTLGEQVPVEVKGAATSSSAEVVARGEVHVDI